MVNNEILQIDMKHVFMGFGDLKHFEGKTVLITGCAGFLGFYFSNFFKYLMENDVDIKSLILLDNFFLGKPEWIREIENIESRISVYTFDVSKDDIASIDFAEKADYVIHMASIASPTYYRKYPIQTVDANIWGLRKLLEFYKDFTLDGFLFFSSSEIYGDPSSEFVPTSEEYRGNVSCVGPRACYDEAKRFGETLCYLYAKEYNLPITVVRPFNNYGPGMSLRDKRLPADFAKFVINNDDLVMYSDGTPTRTFCYVADAIIGYLKALTYGKFDYFNIGADKPEISVKKLAEIYKDAGKEIFGYNGKINFKTSQDKDYLTDNPSRRCPDITKAISLLNFSPQIKVEEGVRRFLEYLKRETGN